MKAFRRNRCIEQLILNLGIRRRWLLSLTPRQLYHLARNPDLHWIGCCVGFRVSLDSVKKRKISYPAGYRVSKCSLCFCPLCRFQVWKIFLYYIFVLVTRQQIMYRRSMWWLRVKIRCTKYQELLPWNQQMKERALSNYLCRDGSICGKSLTYRESTENVAWQFYSTCY